jgi:ABC-type antimicrobial peptide transport system permease subunit
VRLVLLESARDLMLGAVAGLVGGVSLCAVLGRSMEHIGTVDALTTGVTVGLIAVVGIAAACLPALRVLRVQPAQVLRS